MEEGHIIYYLYEKGDKKAYITCCRKSSNDHVMIFPTAPVEIICSGCNERAQSMLDRINYNAVHHDVGSVIVILDEPLVYTGREVDIMSYWVYVSCKIEGVDKYTTVHEANHTSNTAGMMKRALGIWFVTLDKMKASSALPILEKAVKFLKDENNEAAMRLLEPANRWGTLETTTEFLEALCNACREYPVGKISISR